MSSIMSGPWLLNEEGLTPERNAFFILYKFRQKKKKKLNQILHCSNTNEQHHKNLMTFITKQHFNT
jgi:hypothetical protein